MTNPSKIILPDDQEAAPEVQKLHPVRWARENLFSTPFNTILTLLVVLIIVLFFRAMIGFILGEDRRWESVWTNLRLYFTQAYPEDQYVRVWVSLGIVLSLAGLSLAAWGVGGRTAVHVVAKGIRNAALFVTFLLLLFPSVPIMALGVAISLGLISFLAQRWFETNRREMAIHSLAVRATMLAIVLALVWIIPFGQYTFVSGVGVGYAPGHIALSTKLPLTIMGMVLVVAYFIGASLVGRLEGNARFGGLGAVTLMVALVLYALNVSDNLNELPYLAAFGLLAGSVVWFGKGIRERLMRGVLVLGWFLVLPFNLLIVLRDPDWNTANEGGGFDFLTGQDTLTMLGFILLGSAVIALLSNPRLGEGGRLAAGLLLVFSLVIWVMPHEMFGITLPGWLFLIRVRIMFVLLGLFAIGARTFAAGDRRALLRYLALWVGLVLVLFYFLAAINTPSSLQIQAKSFLGGLSLTFVLALTSILLSFPIGLLMALGRTSSMPIFRIISTVYIETVRGIPFITVLIFFDLILVLFLPHGLEMESVTLAILAGTLFSGAYLAENVRGGLQAIEKGQYEAARAMGLSTLQLTVFIVLPQALRAVIPALVGQTIAIFKDTSLVAIIGLFDFLYIANAVIPAQADFLGSKRENLMFIALGYWIFTFSFSRASLRIEKKLGLGER